MIPEIKTIHRTFIYFIVFCTIVTAGSLYFNIHTTKESIVSLAKIEAVTHINKDFVYRQWASMHGGVFVPVTETTQPNPYLTFVELRDANLSNGKAYTLMNPAYMTRQVHELGKAEYGIQAHITSLKPIRPENKPFDWEKKALQKFEKGDTAYCEIATVNDTSYVRYMERLITKKACLTCHKHQGYTLGDVRGGLSVSVPLTKYYNVAQTNIQLLIFIHIATYISLVIISFFIYRRFLANSRFRMITQQEIIAQKQALEQQNKEINQLNDEYKHQNEELQIAKDKAEESNTLKNAFLQNISHEIRTPMNAIIGFSNLLDSQDISDDERKSYSSVIVSGANQLLGILNDIITISSIEAKQEITKYVSFPVTNFIEHIVPPIEQLAIRKGISISVQYDMPDQQMVLCSDKQKLQIILHHVLTNAVKFTPSGSIVLLIKVVGNSIQFSIQDTGIGIPIEMLDEIFEKFRQADTSTTKQYGGLGLGLTISKKYAELLGGSIHIESEVGKGTNCIVTIPIMHKKESIAKKSKQKVAKTTQSATQYTIVIADDDVFNFMLLKAYVKQYNIDVFHAQNGQMAIDFCLHNSNILFVLMDIKMPLVDGVAATKIIKKALPNIPIIAQSAYEENEIDQSAVGLFDDFIHKPIAITTIQNLVTKYSDEYE